MSEQERNVGLIHGSFFGILIGLAVSLFLEAFPHVIGKIPDWNKELVMSFILVVFSSLFFYFVVKKKLELYSLRLFFIALISIFVVSITLILFDIDTTIFVFFLVILFIFSMVHSNFLK